MVNPVGKYKFWDSTTMNGLGTTANDFWPAFEAELDSWITAISGNAGITGAIPIKRKGVADSTNANYLGVVVELPNSTAGTIYALRGRIAAQMEDMALFREPRTLKAARGQLLGLMLESF